MIEQPCCAIFFAPVRTNEKLLADALGNAAAHAARKFATKVQMVLTNVADDNMRPYATQ